jgi:uncharacterized membrane protein
MARQGGSEATVSGPSWPDEAFDLALSYVLRTGVFASAAVVAAGGVNLLARHGLDRVAYRVFTGEPPALRSLGGILASAAALSGRGLVQAGLLLLIATPVARVAFSAVGFVRQRDWLYLGITLTVLGLLAYSLLASS